MGREMSSVSVEQSLERVVEFTDDDVHMREFVAAACGGAPGEVQESTRVGESHRHRIEWKTSGCHGSLDVIRRGSAAEIAVVAHDDTPDSDLGRRLDAALVALAARIEVDDAGELALAAASPSMVVEMLLKQLIHAIPQAQRGSLAPYLKQAATLEVGDGAERRRAGVCVEWAHALAEAQKDVIAQLAADVRDAIDEIVGGFHRELADVQVACAEAHKVAVHAGWDAVPWRDLLERVFSA